MMADQEMMATIMVDDGLMKRNVLIGCNIMVWCSSNDGIIMIKCQKLQILELPTLMLNLIVLVLNVICVVLNVTCVVLNVTYLVLNLKL